MIFFRLAADQEQFLTLAKFRAVRLLWARVEEASGLAPAPVFVSAETAWRMMTRRDPYGNIVRTTIAAHAAATGGADAISVLPFTQAIGLPDGFARRIARNVQLLLRHEAHLDAVHDPARGSGAIEDLTDQLAQAAWALFQQIEAEGGLPAALMDGGFAAQVAAVRQAREQALTTGRDAIIGRPCLRIAMKPRSWCSRRCRTAQRAVRSRPCVLPRPTGRPRRHCTAPMIALPEHEDR